MRVPALIGLATLLAACGDRGMAPENSDQVEPVVLDAQNAGDPGPGALPPLNEGARFVGRWAADQRQCQSAAWTFTQTTLETPAGSHCSFDQVIQVPGGYDIHASCTAEGPVKPDTLHIRFAESAKAMLFESESIADAGLVFCGRDV